MLLFSYLKTVKMGPYASWDPTFDLKCLENNIGYFNILIQMNRQYLDISGSGFKVFLCCVCIRNNRKKFEVDEDRVD